MNKIEPMLEFPIKEHEAIAPNKTNNIRKP